MHKLLIGDNTKILLSNRLIQYKNKIKVIYIDPPYNTKSVKSYSDKKNSNVWINSVMKSINAAYPYLSENGVIYISIDDNEYAYLKVACDDVFGKENFIGTFITQQSQRSNSKLINIVHEYILCYAKNKKSVKEFRLKRTDIAEQKEIIINLQKRIKNVFFANGNYYALNELKKEIKSICEKYNILWIKNYNCIDESGNIYFGKDLSTPSKPNAVCIPDINLYLKPLKTRGWSSPEKLKSLLILANNSFKKLELSKIYTLSTFREPYFDNRLTSV